MKKLLYLIVVLQLLAAGAMAQTYLRIDANNNPGSVVIDTLIKPVMYNAFANGLTANGSITIPKGKTILQVVIKNTTGNLMLGGLKVGTTPGAADVVTALAIPGYSYFAITDNQLLRRVFSDSADQVLYLQAVTGWNGASLNVCFVLKSLN